MTNIDFTCKISLLKNFKHLEYETIHFPNF